MDRSIKVKSTPIVRTSSKYQIAIPKQIRDKLGIKPGRQLAVREDHGRIVLTPLPDDPIRYLRGILKGGPSLTKELLEERARDLEREEQKIRYFDRD